MHIFDSWVAGEMAANKIWNHLSILSNILGVEEIKSIANK